MQPTGALSLRALVSRIHPQLPLSHRESQQLLNILTNSFQQHLDRHHPVRSAAVGHVPGASSPTASSLPSRHSSQVSATEHLNLLLSSPLLAKKPRATSFSTSKANIHPDLQLLPNGPLEWLEDRIASATVTMGHVSLCLNSIWGPWLRGQSNQLKALRELRAGSKIIDWLRSSGQLSEQELFSESRKGIYKDMINLLVVEGRQDVIWSLLVSSSATVHFQRPWLLLSLIRAEIIHGSGLEGAMSAIVKCGSQGLTDNYRGRVFVATRPILHELLSSPHTVPPEIYHQFSETITSWSPTAPFDGAVLSLYHPITPSTEMALVYIDKTASNPTARKAIKTERMRQWHISLCLTLTQRLLAQNDCENANRVLQFAQQQFSTELGLNTLESESIRKQERSEDEIANLQQLDGLFAI